MSIEAAIDAARAESLERAAGSSSTRDRVLASCERSPRRRVHAVVAAVIASMFGATAFAAWHVRAPQPVAPAAPVIERAAEGIAASEHPVVRIHATATIEQPAIELTVVDQAAPPRDRRADARDVELALYASAHRLHFRDRDPTAAVAAWDRYLAAAPDGRLAPEARFNRLVALVRLERWADAAIALEYIDPSFRPRDIERLRALIATPR